MSNNNNNNNDKFHFGFTQSVSSGIIGFHGEVNTNDIEDINKLSIILSLLESSFKSKGYLIASDIEPKQPKEKNGDNNKK